MDTGRRDKNPKAFTLLELLIVMGILGLLFAILMPGISAVRRSANRNQARQQMAGIENALMGFYADYGRFPLQVRNSDNTIGPISQPATADSGHTYGRLDRLLFHDGTASEVTRYIHLINSLRGINPDDNPRNNIYLNVSERNFTEHPSVDPDAIGRQYIDPWMSRFGVVADWDMDGNVDLDTGIYNNDDVVENGIIKNQRVAIVSWGGEGETAYDKHLKSWDP